MCNLEFVEGERVINSDSRLISSGEIDVEYLGRPWADLSLSSAGRGLKVTYLVHTCVGTLQ